MVELDTRTLSAGSQRSQLEVAAIVAVYVAVFLVAVPAVFWALGARLDVLLSLPHLSGVSGVGTAGAIIAVAGFGWMAWSMLLLRIVGGGWPISHLPPVRLVTSGPYRWTKHPIYLGFAVGFAGLALADGSVGGLLAAVVLAIAATAYVAGVEGRGLQKLRDAAPNPHRTRLSEASRAVGSPVWQVLRGPVESLANATVVARVGRSVWVNFGVFIGIGTAVAMGLVGVRLVSGGLSTTAAFSFVVLMPFSMGVGARVAWLVGVAGKMGLRAAMRSTGSVSWGGYVALVLLVIGFAGWVDVSAWWLADRVVTAMLVGSAIGRLGCLSYGCCFGRPWEHGILYHNPDSKVVRQYGEKAGHTPRVPVQLLAGLTTLGAALGADLVSLTPAPAGVVTAVALLLYGLARFGVDALRDASFDAPGMSGWKTGQLVSAAVAVTGWVLLFVVDGPASWTRSAFDLEWSALWSLWPAVALSFLAALVFGGFHWRKVGRW